MKINECKSILKVGDKVRTNGDIYTFCIEYFEGVIGEIQEDKFFVWQNKRSGAKGNIDPETKGYLYSWEIYFNNCSAEIEILTSDSKINNGSEKTMNIKEQFILALTKEPKKSFRMAGVTDGDDILTEDGQKVFLSWLLHSKFAEEFKKEVVDEMLEEIKKDKN